MEIHDVFIIRNGVPIYHKRNDEKTKDIDDTLLMGFLSAITGFGEEIGLGKPFEYNTAEVKFSFYENSELMYVLCTEHKVEKNIIQNLIQTIANNFVEQVPDVRNMHYLSLFDKHLPKIIENCYTQYQNKPQTPKNMNGKKDNFFKQMVPKSHYNGDNIAFSGIRRELFKLINGKNSIYEISSTLTENPNKVLKILRAYQKEGFISF